MLKRVWGAKSNGKLPHLFIPSKTATLVRELAVEDVPLDRTAALVSTLRQNTLMTSTHFQINQIKTVIRGIYI